MILEDPVRKTVESLLVLACSCLLLIHNQIAYSQTRYCTPDMPFNCLVRPSEEAIETCRAELRHLTVTEYPPIIVPHGTEHHPNGGNFKPPKRFLFSQDGIEIYADSPPEWWNLALMDGVKLILVYQDEGVRQGIINNLRRQNLLPAPGTGALVDNLKYAMVHFAPVNSHLLIDDPPGLTLKEKLSKFDKASAEKWYIAEMEYDQPKACVNIFQNDAPGLPFGSGTWITALSIPPDKSVRPDGNHLLSKALQMMLTWMKECASLTA